MEVSKEEWEQFKGSKVHRWMQGEYLKAIQESKDSYFDGLRPEAGLEPVALEAANMKGFIRGLTEAYNLEPDTGESDDTTD